MFAYIKGILEYKHNDYVVVEAGGIGYKIYTALSTIDRCGAVGSPVKLYTYLHVREDAMILFGFLSQEELGMFELLISVSGVGPKAAISLISTIAPPVFGLAVITDDAKTLSKAQGVGLKTAQRIILELKDKIKKDQLTYDTGASDRMGMADSPAESQFSEAISALMVLGYTPLEAKKAVSAVYTEDMDVEQIIKSALKVLVR